MSLPVLDRDNYQHSSSDWVLRAGTALQVAGYLHTEPTGMYDEEFAAAVRAFQEANGISEEDHVGPYTWQALGVDEPAADMADITVVDVGALSEDGQWRWDGAEWVAAVEEHVVAVQVGALSEDGQWQWDGAQWAAAVAAPAGVAAVAADSSDFEDIDLAGSILDYELAILRQWKAALDSFNEVMESETQQSAKPDFAAALLKVFAEKVLGAAAKEMKAELVFDVLKGLVGEAERAKNAQKSVAFRDFYTTHQTHIANLDKELVTKKPVFVAGVRRETERLLRNDPDSYGMLRMELMELFQDADQRLRTATQEALFAELSAEWVSQSVDGEMRIRVREADLSVIDVVIKAPDGDKLVDQLTQQPGGMDVWHMRAEKLVIFMDAAEHAVGYVRLDAANRLTNLPAEQDAKYKQRYQRLVAAGGLAPVTKS